MVVGVETMLLVIGAFVIIRRMRDEPGISGSLW
jgi:hypothetical protein